MPSSATIINTWRRVSATTHHRRPSKLSEDEEDNVSSLRSEPCGPPGDSPGASFLNLPTEMLGQIISHITFQDLGAMRRTCRNAKDLLSEGDILREWLHRNCTAHLLRLYPAPERVTFAYLSSLQKRYAIATEAAALYTEYIERKIVRHSLMRLSPYLRDAKLKEDFWEVGNLMQERMLPLLLTVQHYLESCAAVLADPLSHAPQRSKAPATTQKWLVERERNILESYDPSHLADVYDFWLFLIFTHNQLVRPPSYVGTFERTFRGWKANRLPSHSLNFIIVFGNLNALSQLMRLRSFRDRQKKVEEWKRKMNPATCYPWRKLWAGFELECGRITTGEQAERALKVKPQDGEVFSNGARAVLVEQGLLDQDADTAIGTTQQCTDFLCHIAGYDVLHILPSHRPTMLVDEDTEWCAVCEDRHLASDCPTAYVRH
ncbi:hypothetical protein B0A55_08746 [Friedmanniomyces simplex]|uniref:F-box domain-containing protein n=1 Tax=Friedmanniomyces simplex TaxID=329884 RepID=A0A4U0WXA8_9PEZI|nr:hypothetical protein B0A55_08746 [Friedmanniomyces simplex]